MRMRDGREAALAGCRVILSVARGFCRSKEKFMSGKSRVMAALIVLLARLATAARTQPEATKPT
jgi:hypothetical protein